MVAATAAVANLVVRFFNGLLPFIFACEKFRPVMSIHLADQFSMFGLHKAAFELHGWR